MQGHEFAFEMCKEMLKKNFNKNKVKFKRTSTEWQKNIFLV